MIPDPSVKRMPRTWATYIKQNGEIFVDLDELCLVIQGLEGKQLEISKLRMIELAALAESFLEIRFEEQYGTGDITKNAPTDFSNTDLGLPRKGSFMKDLNWLALEVVTREVGKEQVDIAQVKEILHKLGEIFSELDDIEVNNLLNRLIEKGQKH